MLLATIIVVIVPSSTAEDLVATDDGISLPGLFFARLNDMRAQRRSLAHGKVCVRVPTHCPCMTLNSKGAVHTARTEDTVKAPQKRVIAA
jgi:hypothetical protein